MIFKLNWEKAGTQNVLPRGIIPKMIAAIYPNKKIKSYHVILGGCANINIKFQLENNKKSQILRIYLRDKGSVYREQKIGDLLKREVPVPQINHIGNIDGYCFAIADLMPGKSLGDLLLKDKSFNICKMMCKVGILLSKIAQYKFAKAGFFDQNLHVVTPITREGYINFGNECLQDTCITSQLTTATLSKINYHLEKHGYLFPDKNENNLVHADFDPANILVNKVDDNWEVSGVLDWEFSFSGSILHDVANMLRYAHQMLPCFQDGFLKGLRSGGVILPEKWCASVYMLNLLSLLDCLKRSDLKNQPNRCADICELIDYILLKLTKF